MVGWAYERAELKPREQELAGKIAKTNILPIIDKESAMQAIIYLLSEYKIQPQEVVEEYNRLVH